MKVNLMNSQNMENIRLSELYSYFEKEDLQISNEFNEKLIIFNDKLQVIKNYSPKFKKIIKEKLIDFEQTKIILQSLENIDIELRELEAIHNGYDILFTNISNILGIIPNLVRKIPFVFDLSTGFSFTGGKVNVQGSEESFIYSINHQNLVDFIINIKNLIKPSTSIDNNFQVNPISSNIKQISITISFLKEEYCPNVLYIQIPESIERIIDLGNNLKNLFNPYKLVIGNNFLLGQIKSVIDSFNNIREHFIQNSEDKEIKLKGKFKDAYSTVSEFNRLILLMN